MPVTGGQLIAGKQTEAGSSAFAAHDPADGTALEPRFLDATPDEVAAAVTAAVSAAADLRTRRPDELAALLDTAAQRLEQAGDDLIARAERESRLGETRLRGELARTCGQLRLFAAVVADGAHLDVIIDHPDPDATPPRPDLRRMLVPIGPVAVFGASNFPLAFGVAGGDTASAWASGCPVVAKGHPSNAGTSELVARCLQAAVEELGFHPGAISLIQGAGTDVGQCLVREPDLAAVGFTGSLRGGRALFDLAAQRPNPIPVYAEMGSTNPVWLAPGALARRGHEIAGGFIDSVTLGVGQFCTKPGVAFVPDGPDAAPFLAAAGRKLEAYEPGPLLDERLAAAYVAAAERLLAVPGVSVVARTEAGTAGWRGPAVLLTCDATAWVENPELREECFGPLAIVVTGSPDDLVAAAERIDGALSATIHRDPDDAELAGRLRDVLTPRVGRLIYDGFPTGVAVTWAMHHGGPYPATTAPLHTSVGATAIRRFLRPLTVQDAPEPLLPPALHDADPWRLPRRIDGVLRLAEGG